jgi:hypothetical protein
MTWIDLLEKSGVFLILSGATIYLIRYFIDRKFKSYEFELQNSAEEFKKNLEFSLETYKKSLEELNYKANKLHDRRIEIIPELYRIIVDLDMSMNSMTSLWKIVTGEKEIANLDEKKRIDKSSKHFNEYQEFYNKNRIYFPKNTCELLDKLRTEFWDGFWDYTFKYRLGSSDTQFNTQLAKKASEKVKNDIPPILKQLEDDFRKIMNVVES